MCFPRWPAKAVVSEASPMEMMEDETAFTGDWGQPQEGYNPNDPQHRATFLAASVTRVQDAYPTELDRLVLTSSRRADDAATLRVLDVNRDGHSLCPSHSSRLLVSALARLFLCLVPLLPFCFGAALLVYDWLSQVCSASTSCGKVSPALESQTNRSTSSP